MQNWHRNSSITQSVPVEVELESIDLHAIDQLERFARIRNLQNLASWLRNRPLKGDEPSKFVLRNLAGCESSQGQFKRA